MICSFCGLETGTPISHETQAACIDALRAQVSELRTVLQHARRPDEPLDIPPEQTEPAVAETARR